MANQIVGRSGRGGTSARLAVNDDPVRSRLIFFARFCVTRLTRELAGADGWEVSYDQRADETVAMVRARMGDQVVIARGAHADPAIAVWNAMCRIEQPLRDAWHDTYRGRASNA